ncbi:MAG: TetR/AcrR family transcriptional regulator, partial [Actinobacteria bacterium]|nr:TetR/AcrR family transcriptional regulator [Actinomycetota bacterium]
PLYAQMLVGMVAIPGGWWLDSRKFKKHDVAAHLVNLAWNGLAGMESHPTLRTQRPS